MATHRHTPEIEEQLGYAAGKAVVINFTPHLDSDEPWHSGITAYATLNPGVSRRVGFLLMKQYEAAILLCERDILFVYWK